MSSDVELKAPDGLVWSLDNLVTHNRMRGEAEGLFEASTWLKIKSGEAYASHDDAKAKVYRDLSVLLAQKGDDRREKAKKYEAEYPSCIDDG